MDISVGICAYNERENISRLLDALIGQQMKKHRISEIIVISSGSTDDTDDIVSDFSKKDPRVRLITQKKKEGKASAINLFFKKSQADLIVLVSADLVPNENTIEILCGPFENPAVGMTTGRPIPDNKDDTFMGFTVNLIWELHHKLQLKMPKANEILALRPVVDSIDVDTAVDDLQIEALIKKKGYLTVYTPDAIVKNHGPETVSDLIRQRSRIIIGYLHTKHSKDYYPITMEKMQVISTLLESISFRPKKLLFTAMAVALEVYIRLKANVEYYVFKRNPYNWDIAESTKKLR